MTELNDHHSTSSSLELFKSRYSPGLYRKEATFVTFGFQAASQPVTQDELNQDRNGVLKKRLKHHFL